MALAITLTASGQVKAGPGYVIGYRMQGGSDASSLILKNALTDTGSSPLGTVSLATTVDTGSVNTHRTYFSTGIYATITGTTPQVTIWYE